MSERIDLAQLRANALVLKHGGAGYIEDLCAEPDEVLALIDAVEAARRERDWWRQAYIEEMAPDAVEIASLDKQAAENGGLTLPS